MLLGGKCKCCGESALPFLTIDHIKPIKGAANRKNLLVLYSDIVAGIGRKLYQVLCWNCNCARELNSGVCPHKDKKHKRWY